MRTAQTAEPEVFPLCKYNEDNVETKRLQQPRGNSNKSGILLIFFMSRIILLSHTKRTFGLASSRLLKLKISSEDLLILLILLAYRKRFC
jgi:hypothetical protein